MKENITFKGNKTKWRAFSEILKNQKIEIWDVIERFIDEYMKVTPSNTESNTVVIPKVIPDDVLKLKKIVNEQINEWMASNLQTEMEAIMRKSRY